MAWAGLAGLTSRAKRLQQRLHRWQKPLLAVATIAVIVGCALSLDALDLRWSDVRLAPLLTMALLIIPASIAYSALNMMLMGRAANVPVDFRLGVKVSVFAQIADLLPIPGGAIVRTAALIRAGGSTGRSAELVVAFSLLWIACAAAAAGLALAEHGLPAHALAATAAMSALAICGWLAARYGATIAATAAALRLLGVALVATRLMLAFAVIGTALPWLDSATFAFATILGSAASLIPAGLGVGEALSALAAGPAGIAPAAAFLAAALSRLLGFAVNITLALAYLSAERASGPQVSRG
jgi:hypothetical protein